jgi:hypothetical protein
LTEAAWTTGRGHFLLAEGVRAEFEPKALDLASLQVHLISFARFLAGAQAGDVRQLATAAGLGLASIWLGTSDRKFANLSPQ